MYGLSLDGSRPSSKLYALGNPKREPRDLQRLPLIVSLNLIMRKTRSLQFVHKFGGVFLASLLSLTMASISVIAQSDCFPHDTAYIAGNMNIREEATTSSRVVATARRGDSFSVQSSERGHTWCWIEIDSGWIAKTIRVSPTRPSTTSPQPSTVQQPVGQESNIDNCCYVDRQCASNQEWTDGYWAYQRNECPGPATSSSSNTGQTEHIPPTTGEGGDLSPIVASASHYQFLAEGEYTTGTVFVSAGTWHLQVVTAATTLAYAESPGDRCFGRWRGERVLVASKYHNVFGGNNEANGQFTVTKDCNVRFYVWAPRHAWTLNVTKIG